MSETLNKNEIRKQAKDLRSNIKQDFEEIEQAVSLFFEHFDLKNIKSVAGYWPIKDEFDCRPLLDDLIEKGVDVCLPVVLPDSRILAFRPWNGKDNLEDGAFGTKHPEEILEETPEAKEDFYPSHLLVPLLAFDMKGNRLGYGSGYYDSTIKSLKEKKEIVTIGWAYGEQACLFNLPAEKHDEKLNYVITPQQVIEF